MKRISETPAEPSKLDAPSADFSTLSILDFSGAFSSAQRQRLFAPLRKLGLASLGFFINLALVAVMIVGARPTPRG